ncbi:transmembrane protein, putative [Medicago truncatula]|uniref:Transmembrane protein, putative n=1 Tax=Medicago truncatula TaxID=3880 RepID=A0A072UJG3_MEDTR|nr:transmembrane protein, putative [Medicago truncatula]
METITNDTHKLIKVKPLFLPGIDKGMRNNKFLRLILLPNSILVLSMDLMLDSDSSLDSIVAKLEFVAGGVLVASFGAIRSSSSKIRFLTKNN